MSEITEVIISEKRKVVRVEGITEVKGIVFFNFSLLFWITLGLGSGG